MVWQVDLNLFQDSPWFLLLFTIWRRVRGAGLASENIPPRTKCSRKGSNNFENSWGFLGLLGLQIFGLTCTWYRSGSCCICIIQSLGEEPSVCRLGWNLRWHFSENLPLETWLLSPSAGVRYTFFIGPLHPMLDKSQNAISRRLIDFWSLSAFALEI